MTPNQQDMLESNLQNLINMKAYYEGYVKGYDECCSYARLLNWAFADRYKEARDEVVKIEHNIDQIRRLLDGSGSAKIE